MRNEFGKVNKGPVWEGLVSQPKEVGLLPNGRWGPLKDFQQGSSSLLEGFLYGCTVEIEVRKPVGSLLKASRHETKSF